MYNLDDMLMNLERQMSSNEEQMRASLSDLSLAQLFDETNTIRVECNQNILEYNRMNEDDSESELPLFPEVDIENTKNQLINQFIELYQHRFSLVVIMESRQDLQQALERYNQVVLGSEINVDQTNRPVEPARENSTLTAFQSQKEELGAQYAECYKTIQHVKATQQLEQEQFETLQALQDSLNNYDF